MDDAQRTELFGLKRRTILRSALLAPLASSRLAAATEKPKLRLGVLSFGTVQWVADVIRRHGLDAAHGVQIESIIVANNDAGRIALMASSADIIVTDWLFVASARARGTPLCFSPFSSATGGIMVRKDASFNSLHDLTGHALGIAGGPIDKSWLIVQAAARQGGDDLAATSRLSFGAPPLLEAKLLQKELDAALTFWNFAARLQAKGCKEIVSVADCAATLGLPRQLNLVGFAFHEPWAQRNQAAVNGFLEAAADAQGILAQSPTEWAAIRPLMRAPEDALYEQLKQRFIAGIAHSSTAADQEREAGAVLAVLLRTGGTRATEGLTTLPSGVFWRGRDART